MAAFIFFSTVWRRLRSQPPTGAPQMFRGGDFDIDKNGSEARDHPSSEDLLLDLQLRRFFKREYGHAQPPESAFVRLMRANTQYASRLPSLTEAAYRSLTGQISARLLSSGVALAVLLAVLGANTSQLLRGGQDEVFRDAPARATTQYAIHNSQQAVEVWRERLEAEEAELPTPHTSASPRGLMQVEPSDDLIMTSPHRPLKSRGSAEQQDLMEPPLMLGSQF
jgi:hypothetical protein